MKTCPKCKSIYEHYDQCPKCKLPLVDEINEVPYGPSMVEEYEANLVGYHQPIGEPIKTRRKATFVLKQNRNRILLVLVAVITVTVGLYLNFSQVPRPMNIADNGSFYEMAFDGEYMKLHVSSSGLNDYFDQQLETWREDSLWGLDISDIFYDGNRKSMVVQLDSSIVHTSLMMDFRFDMKEDHLILSIDNPRLGTLEVPIIENWIDNVIVLPEEVRKGIKVPRYVTVENFEFEEEGITFYAKIDIEYMKSIINDYQGSLDLDYYAYAKSVNPYVWLIENHMMNYDQSTVATKSFLYEISKNPEYLRAGLLLVDEPSASRIVDRIFDGLPTLLSYNQVELLKDHRSVRSRLEEGYEVWFENQINQEILTFWESMIYSIDEYHKQREEATFFVESKGRVYSLTTQEYLSLTTLLMETSLNLPYGHPYELYAEGVMPVIGIAVGDEYYITKDGINIIKYASRQDWLDEIGYQAQNDTPAKLLDQNDEFRMNWEERISKYLSSTDGLFVRYLSSDGTNTYGIVSKRDNPQEIYQVLTETTDAGTRILDVYQEHDSINKEIIRHLKNKGFNVRVLPPYDIADFTLWFYADYQVEELTSHLKTRGEIEETDQVYYISRVEDMLFVVFDSGRQFFFDFKYGSNLDYDAYYKVFNNMSIRYYYYLLIDDQRYGYYLPTFIFLQE